MEFEAAEGGRIAKLVIAGGTDNVTVGTVIALLAGEKEALPESAMADLGRAAFKRANVESRHAYRKRNLRG